MRLRSITSTTLLTALRPLLLLPLVAAAVVVVLVGNYMEMIGSKRVSTTDTTSKTSCPCMFIVYIYL